MQDRPVEPKPEKDSGDPALANQHVSVKVVNQNGSDVHFKIKRTTPLRKLMEAYCSRQSVNVASVRFLFNGERLNPDQTPGDIGLEEDDVIDAVLMQTGGA